jgi:hypothetical protein
MKLRNNFYNFGVIILLCLLILLSNSVIASSPSGASVDPLGSSSSTTGDVGSDGAQAGNITELAVTGISTTQSWQGYYGNVTGTIQLADGNSNVIYNWSLASPKGQIYASTNNSIQWANIQCFNFTATGTYDNETGNGGSVNQFGTNITQLEAAFGMAADESDSVDQTFSLEGADTHNVFYTSNVEFTEGKCKNTRIFDDSGAGANDHFEEALLYEPKTASVVFASILNQDLAGFDSAKHDFEMLVLENGHGADVETTPYYFFVELR